ncbi:MAG: hypothetical protein N2560_10160 [Ignavibacteria bacterium]|nr:hypothetical protein [Ignavibacteria bacterium]
MNALIKCIPLLISLSFFSFSQPKFVLPCDSALLIQSRFVLLEQVGVRERTNKNDGTEVEKYLRSVGLSKGNAYCVAGQYFCFLESTRKLKYPETKIPLPKTGLSLKLFTFAVKQGRKVCFSVEMDDLVIWLRKNSIHGHTERIIQVYRKGWVETVGFNTKKYDATRKTFVEGVFRWKRNLNHPLKRFRLLGIVGFRN